MSADTDSKAHSRKQLATHHDSPPHVYIHLKESIERDRQIEKLGGKPGVPTHSCRSSMRFERQEAIVVSTHHNHDRSIAFVSRPQTQRVFVVRLLVVDIMFDLRGQSSSLFARSSSPPTNVPSCSGHSIRVLLFLFPHSHRLHPWQHTHGTCCCHSH